MRKKTWLILVIILVITILSTSGCGTRKENLLKNPSFEETMNGQPAGWEIMVFNPKASVFKIEQGRGHSGHQYITIISHEPNDARYWQRVPVTEFKCYKVTAWLKTESIGNQEAGANISVMESLLISTEIRGTHRKWELIELYFQAGKGVQSVSIAFGLGGYGSINTGTVIFDNVRMQEVEILTPGTVVAAPGTVENANSIIKPSFDTLLFDYGFMIWIFLIIIIILILIYRDQAQKQGLYFPWKTYLLLAGLLLIFFKLYITFPNHLSTQTIHLSFVVLLGLAIVCAFFLWKTGKWKSDTLIIILIILGIAVRICYFLYTGFDNRQHDILGEWGHLDYIRYIANHWSLPASGGYQLYHPPIHHIISAVIFFLGKLVGLDEPLQWRLVQLGMVFLSSLTLIFFYKILKQLNCGNTAKTVGVAIFAFHPTNILLSVFLNNDNTLLFFFVLTFYFLIRWLNQHTLRNVCWLAIFTSLALLTKKSAFVLLPIIFIVVLVTWFKDRSNFTTYVKQTWTFLVITIPAAIIYPLRSYYLFHQGMNYAPLVPFDPLSKSLSALFGVSVKKMFQYPFTIFSYGNIDLEKNPESFMEYLFKSSLFGEWEFGGIKIIALLLVAFALVNLVNMILAWGHYYLTKGKNTGIYDLLFWLNIIFLCGLVLKARLDSPYFCTQNFRYLAPALISISYLYGQAVQRLTDLKKTGWKYFSVFSLVGFCVAAALFILMIG